MSDLPRRAWLVGCAGVVVGVAQTIWSTCRFARAPVTYGPPTKATLGPIDAFAPGATTYVPSAKVLVRREGDEVRVMSAVCTHLGCTVRQDGEGYTCPCHGSRYDKEGHVVSGPAPASLTYYKLTKDRQEQLVVDLGHPVDPDTSLRVL